MNNYRYCPLCGFPLEKKLIDNRDRLTCSSPKCPYVFWNNPLPVVAALIEHEGKVLLARNRAWPLKVFGLISGFLEAGEAPDEAILREISEETGLRASIVSLIGLYPHEQANQVLIVYHAVAEGDIDLNPEEIAEVKHVPREKLRPWPFGTGLAVKDWLKNK